MIRRTIGAAAGAILLLAGCSRSREPNGGPPAPAHETPSVTFSDVTQEAGIRFRHINGAAGQKYLPETMGAGCAFLDYDADGWLDLLFVNGTRWPNNRQGARGRCALYRNLGGGRFRDVSRESGMDIEIYGMGAAVADYDNDGFDDVLITGVGEAKLLHNAPRGGKSGASGSNRRFEDATQKANLRIPGWSTSAAWLDIDRDGWLDLFVSRYVKWSAESDTKRFFSLDGVHRSYATPQEYEGEPCMLFRNLKGQRFLDISAPSGIAIPRSKALGVAVTDIDQDGWCDIVVANDTEANFLFHNQGDHTFKEVALETGIAVAETGEAKAGMGIDTGDEKRTGWESLAITNFSGEQMSLYRRGESGQYLDEAAASGIGGISQMYLGFGVLFLDYDNDGWLDLFVANGHIQDDADIRRTGVAYRQPALLLRNQGRTFTDASALGGAVFSERTVGRGAAWGDYDNDGDPDLIVTSNGGPARLLRNDGGNRNNWIRLVLRGASSNRNAIGTRVRLHSASGTQTATVKGGSSYLSASDRRTLFGLGADREATLIEIQWPNGQIETLGPFQAGKSYTIAEGDLEHRLSQEPPDTSARNAQRR